MLRPGGRDGRGRGEHRRGRQAGEKSSSAPGGGRAWMHGCCGHGGSFGCLPASPRLPASRVGHGRHGPGHLTGAAPHTGRGWRPHGRLTGRADIARPRLGGAPPLHSVLQVTPGSQGPGREDLTLSPRT
ncbi:hypothetical protein [Ornithinimicrobium kibberense]|uniref:hypothetical protein n=1 Tax=Ornithinimicrobium kibberense TaxID=282060 RepID=UPI00360C3E62